MNKKQQIDEFIRRLRKTINGCTLELDLTYAEIIGAMTIECVLMTVSEQDKGKDKSNEDFI